MASKLKIGGLAAALNGNGRYKFKASLFDMVKSPSRLDDGSDRTRNR